MPEAPRYWSPPFIQAFVEALNTDEAFRRTAGSFSHTIVLRCLDAPGEEDIEASYAFEDGQVVDVDVWIDDAPSDALRQAPFDRRAALARASATYDVWVRLDRGEMNVVQALASPDYRIEGPKIKIMANIGVFNGMNRVAAEVDKTY